MGFNENMKTKLFKILILEYTIQMNVLNLVTETLVFHILFLVMSFERITSIDLAVIN